MRVLTKDEVHNHKYTLLRELKRHVCVYPTDTVYGIGANALDKQAVARIREIKHSNIQPFSVIAPSKAWIREHCIVTPETETWLAKLPGPYTLILPLKDKTCIAQNVNNGAETLGVRIPDHWIAEFVEELGMPFVTTSANVTGEEIMTSLDDLDPRIKDHVDYILYEGPKRGRASTLVHLEQDKVKIKKR